MSSWCNIEMCVFKKGAQGCVCGGGGGGGGGVGVMAE